AMGVAAATYRSEGPPVTVQLGKADPISQTVVDPAGRPVAGTRVRIWRIGAGWGRPSAGTDRGPGPIGPFWPKPVVTNEDGKFSFSGIGGLSPVIVEMLAPGCVRTDAMFSEGAVKIPVRSPKWVSGNVRAAKTGKPVVGAEISYPARFPAT